MDFEGEVGREKGERERCREMKAEKERNSEWVSE